MLRAGMRPIVDAAKAASVDVRVHLRRRERAVPEQFLNRAQVGSALEQVGCERVAEPVGVRQQASQRAGVESSASRGQEERVLGASGELRACLVQVAGEPVRRLLTERYRAFLVALAVDAHELLLEVDVSEIEIDGLAAAQACGVHELAECAVSQAE